jgi:nucleoside-diphosphate-sugar epimerase
MEPMTADSTVLVTGGTGVVGEPLMARLPAASTVCLTHERPLESAGRTVTGDVSKPRLGLSGADYDSLAREVDCVVHAAAATRFDTTREEYTALNVEGTRNVVEFAAHAGARLVHVSSAYVEVTRRPPPQGVLDPTGYVISKEEGEEVVRASGLDWHIARPSYVLAHSPGSIPAGRQQGFHYFIRALLKEDMPVLPADDDTRLDLVPADLVAQVLALMAGSKPPGKLSLVAAGEEAWTVAQAVEVCMEIFAEAGHKVTAPRLASREMIERLMKPAFYDELPRRYVRRFEQMDSLGVVMLTPRPFESSLGELAAHYGEPLDPELDKTFGAAVRDLVETKAQPVA